MTTRTLYLMTAGGCLCLLAACSSPPENDPVLVPPEPGTRQGNPAETLPNTGADTSKPVDDFSSSTTTGSSAEPPAPEPLPEPTPPPPGP